MAAQEESMFQIPDFVVYLVFAIISIGFGFVLVDNVVASEARVDFQTLERATTEIAENLLASPLTTSKSVFSSKELDKINGRDEEPFVSHCRYAYRAEIDSNGKKWSFGFEPKKASSLGATFEKSLGYRRKHELKVPVSVDENAGIMRLTVYEDTLTQVTCIAQRAYVLKKEEKIPCKIPASADFELPQDMKAVTCQFLLEKVSDNVCIFHPSPLADKNPIECRNMKSIQLEKFTFSGKKEDKPKNMFLHAYPLKPGAAADCENLKDEMIARGTDIVSSILLCVKEK